MGIITIQGYGILYSAAMDSLKMGKINEGITDLAGIDIMLIIITISLEIHILSLKSDLITVPKRKFD